MHSKRHRKNHNFQILYFLVGACQTHDAAYSLLQDQKEDRELAIEAYHVSQLKNKAKRIRASRLANSSEEDQILMGQAKLLELDYNEIRSQELYEAAMDELKFIEECIEKINPLRKYKHLSDPEACEACQQEEWKLELIRRSENFLLTTRTIPSDHFDTMRMHPEFESAILPQIQVIEQYIRANADINNIIGHKHAHLLENT